MNIPQPHERNINVAADAFDKQVTEPFERILDLSRHFRWLFNNPKQALNVDSFGEVANSTWFTNRNGTRRMSIEEITRGPDTGSGPDTSDVWTVFKAKAEGVTPGFHIKDARGDRYVIKFDPPGYPELTTGAEVISTKLFYAAGYNVPENYIVVFKPEILKLDKNVKFTDKKGKKRLMTEEDLIQVISGLFLLPDGRLRAVASKYIPGKPIGPFKYTGCRKDDLNDIISHQHRRELRGLRVMSAWLNHFDTKAGNSYDAYITKNGRSYVKHYLIDFGSTLGSGATGPDHPQTGHENYVDPLAILERTATLGLHVRSYEKPDTILYPAIGRYTSANFHPQKYKFHIPNPAFQNLTGNDGWWGAKLVMSFSDEQLEAVVGMGLYSNPDAAAYLLRVLNERRDIVGRYWSERMNPLDRFELLDGTGGRQRLGFTDLAVEWGFASPEESNYHYEILMNGRRMGEGETSAKNPTVDLPDIKEIHSDGLHSTSLEKDDTDILEIRIKTHRAKGNKHYQRVRVFLANDQEKEEFHLLGAVRDE